MKETRVYILDGGTLVIDGFHITGTGGRRVRCASPSTAC